jgi:hypothetical protein
MQKSLMLVLMVAAAGPATIRPADEGPKAFAQPRSLVGDWRGTVQWSGAQNTTGAANASYRLTGNGSALVEDLVIDGTTMTSVYHLDGRELRMTHYCAAQNQPRLKARSFDAATATIAFEFVDATNLASPEAAHVHGFVLRNPDHDHLELQFMFDVGAKHSVERITLARAQAGPD